MIEFLFEADIGAAVLGTAFTCSVVGYRFVLSLALAAYLLRLNALAYHVCLECLGTLLTPYGTAGQRLLSRSVR